MLKSTKIVRKQPAAIFSYFAYSVTLRTCPLHNLKAASICDKLLSFWCTVGLPNEIFCDQMSSFKSQLMTPASDKFHRDKRYSSVYHSQSHRGIERKQRTVEDMLRKFLTKKRRNWDKNVEFLQYA